MDYNALILESPLVQDARTTLRRHRSKKWKTREPSEIRGVVYHQAMGMRYAGQVADYHVEANHIAADGLPGLAYTMFVEPTGTAFLCHDVEAKTWSQGDRTRPGDENAAYLAVCFGGNFSGPGYFYPGTPTRAQLNAAVDLWEHLRQTFGLDSAALYGHFDFGKPACPGYTLEALVRELRTDGDSVLWSQPNQRQQILRDLGVYGGAVDNQWGLRSATALNEFRFRCKLPEGGWDPEVEKAFLRWLNDEHGAA